MTREERLVFCKVCINSKPDFQKGLLCGITNALADFEDSCPDYHEDVDEKKRLLLRDLHATGDPEAGTSLDYKKNQEKGAAIAVGSLLMFFIVWTSMDQLPFLIVLPIGTVIWGAQMYFKGVEQKRVLVQAMQEREKRNGRIKDS